MKHIFGITGWKNSGKTSLIVALVEEFVNRGLVVNTIKHASSNLQFDKEGTDSFRHQNAGATQTALVTKNKWVIQHTQNGKENNEIELEDMIKRLDSCDLILVEGFKTASHPKIECLVGEQSKPLYQSHENIVALACDEENMKTEMSLPAFLRDDVVKIADFIVQYLELKK